MGDWQAASARFAKQSEPPPNGKPIALDGTVEYDNSEIIVNFDRPLWEESLLTSNWSALGRRFQVFINTVVAVGSRLEIAVAPTTFIFGPPQIRYYAFTPDLRSAEGIFADAIDPLPLTVINEP